MYAGRRKLANGRELDFIYVCIDGELVAVPIPVAKPHITIIRH